MSEREETIVVPGDDKSAGTPVPCACNADPFAALPPEERPRGKPPMGNLRHVICPVCGLEYWTNRNTDTCPACEERTS